MFFSFDGVDGAGKTTQRELFCRWLRERGHTVLTCRDPGGTALGETLRGILLTPANTPICRTAEMLLYMASRAQLVEEVLRPALAAKQTIVCDRYLLANIVYQGYAGGLSLESVRDVGDVATGQLLPDLTFVLDLDPAAALARIQRAHDRMEQQGLAFQQRVREGFLAEAARDPARIKIIDASQSVDAMHAEILAHAERALAGA